LQERLSKTVRGAPKNLSKRESELLLAVNESFAHVQWQRYFELIDEREAETITKDELAELVELSNEIEEANAKRLQYLIELAQLRNVSLEQLMDDLDLKPALPAYTSRVTPFQ
jgi:hypothetical protein